MVPGLQGELRAQLTAQTAEGVEFMLGQLDRQLGAPLGHKAEWYNADEQLSNALNEMLRARRELAPSGAACAKLVRELESAERTRYGLDVTGLRAVGWDVRALVAARFGADTLREGGFDAAALLAARTVGPRSACR